MKCSVSPEKFARSPRQATGESPDSSPIEFVLLYARAAAGSTPNPNIAVTVKDISDITVCVIDHGTFFPVAQRLARDAKRVLYHIPHGDAFETFAKGVLGDGHDDVELCDDFWKIKKEIDVFVFPDVGDSGLQLELEAQGFPVWGTKDADSLETMRGMWLKACEAIGLPMPKTHVIKGLTNLRLFFDEHDGEEFFVKISRFRGDMETFKVKERSAMLNKLDVLAMKFGPFKELRTFYVQEPVDTDIEGGADSYFVNGQYPDKIILGYEKKGESYFATWREREKMPPEIWKVSEAMTDMLASYRYCNTVSSEVRVNKEGSYLLDPCLRFPSPAGEEELEMYGNFTEIVYRGAMGEMVQPEMTAKFCGEAVIEYCGDRDGWKSLAVPEEVRQWVKLYACGYCDGAYHFPPGQDPEAIGCAVGLGDTPEEVLDRLKEIRDALKDCPVSLNIEPIADLFKEIEEAEAEGIPFSKQPMPEPAEVLT